MVFFPAFTQDRSGPDCPCCGPGMLKQLYRIVAPDSMICAPVKAAPEHAVTISPEQAADTTSESEQQG